MNKWVRWIRDTALMGLFWAVLWAPVAVLVGVMIVDPDNSMDEMWVVVGAYPGFLSGAVFSVLLRISPRGRRFDGQSISRVAVLGAVSGLLVGLIPALLPTSVTEVSRWMWAAYLIGGMALMAALSAVVSAVLSRAMRKRAMIGA